MQETEASVLRPQDLDAVDRRLLTLAQKEFPLASKPYEIFGQQLGISEQECLHRIGRPKAGHILRQGGAVFFFFLKSTFFDHF